MLGPAAAALVASRGPSGATSAAVHGKGTSRVSRVRRTRGSLATAREREEVTCLTGSVSQTVVTVEKETVGTRIDTLRGLLGGHLELQRSHNICSQLGKHLGAARYVVPSTEGLVGRGERGGDGPNRRGHPARA